MPSFDVCIIGAGVGGLSVALNIQRLMRLVNVTVIADSFGTETNTPLMESVFIPAPSTVEMDIEPTVAREWFIDGWSHHYELATSPEGAASGNTLKTGRCLWWHDGEHVLPKCVADYRSLSRQEMDKKEYNCAYGCEFTTVHIDLHNYLRYLLKEIRENGGQVKYDTVFSLQELYGQYDVVVNCAGRRCRELKADHELQFIRGSMLQTSPIDTDQFLIAQDNVYICPHPRTGLCDVGFIWETRNYDKEMHEDTEWLIMHRASKYVPELKNCKVVETTVEKKPHRDPILLEIEFLNCGGPILPIVHNIGHGEKTLSLAWGRGVHAAHLVQQVQRTVKPFVKIWRPFNRLM